MNPSPDSSKEREAVVRWLRTKLTPCGYNYANAKWFADSIERGEHFKEKPNG